MDSDTGSNPDSNFCFPLTTLLRMDKIALLPPGASYDKSDSNPDSDSNNWDSDSDSRK